MRASTFTLDTADGTPVHVHVWLPDGEVGAVVQVAHGLAEHGARYERLARHLTGRGYAVYADDHRGHGRTAATEADLGFFAEHRGWALLVDDLHRLSQRIRDDHPAAPLVVLGHSMGSYLTQQLLFTFPDAYDAAVLSGSMARVGPSGEVGALLARVERRRLGPRGRSPLLHALAFAGHNRPFEPARTEYDWLSRDEVEVDRYAADPWCGFVSTTQAWLDVFSGLRLIQRDDLAARVRPDLPLYLLSGSEDPLCGSAGLAALEAKYRRAGVRDITVADYDGARHETLNEVNRDEVTSDLLDWLDRVTGPTPDAAEAVA